MKTYDVYGVGAALVDIEYKVDENFLQENQVDKGLMTLVDEDRQYQLTVAASYPRMGVDPHPKAGHIHIIEILTVINFAFVHFMIKSNNIIDNIS